MSDTFLTIAADGEAIHKEKMSKFLAFAHHAECAAQAREIIARYQKKYFDARHVCWAYMVGHERTEYLSSDNGEPSGTAGKPILGQINSFGLTDVVIVVVRYFGGIKLGTSGLIAAYREAARMAIQESTVEERHRTVDIAIVFPYLAMNDVMRIVKNSGARIAGQQFDNTCSMTLTIRADDAPALRSGLADTDGVSIL